MSNNRFLAIVGTVIVVLIGILTFQKLSQCAASGGTACCFARLCGAATGQPAPASRDAGP
jgi:hypothetical protein